MFEILVASGDTAATERAWGARAASLLVHSALIATAIAATHHGAAPATVERLVTPVYLPRPSAPAPPAPPAPVTVCRCTPALPVSVEIPPVIPSPVPVPVDPGTSAWPVGDSLGAATPGVPGTPGSVLTPTAPIDARFAEEPPLLLSHPEARYPGLLREAGFEGRVVVEVVVDTLGRAEPRTLRIATSAHPLFDAEASTVVLGSRYRPGRVGGRPVRVRILVPVAFSLRR